MQSRGARASHRTMLTRQRSNVLVLLRSSLLPFLLALLLSSSGCGTVSPPASVVLHAPVFTSRDGILHYRLPAGWFDVTADSQATGKAVWLVRNDYAATLTVREMYVDSAAREELHRQGLTSIARMTARLEAGSKAGVVVHQPESLKMNGTPACVYDIADGAGDTMRTILFDTGDRLYAVALLLNAGTGAPTAEEAYGVQKSFAEALRW